MKQTILIVGAAGPMGRAIARELATSAFELKLTSRSDRSGFEQLDVTDRVQTRRVLEKTRPTAVIYLATPDLNVAKDPSRSASSAVAALNDLALDCAELGSERLIFASTAAVYNTDEKAPQRESDATRIDSPYAALKLESEDVLRRISSSSDLRSLSFRIFNVYGPGFSKSLVNRIVLDRDSLTQVFNTDEFVRDYVHCIDVARAFSAAVSASELDSSIINLGTGTGTSNRELVGMFAGSISWDSPPSDVRSYSIADISLLRSSLQFEPSIALASAMRSPEEYLL